MSKTKFRSLGIGFLFSALILAAVSFAWPLVPDQYKEQLNEWNLPKIGETYDNPEVKPSESSEISTEESIALESSLKQEAASLESSLSAEQTSTTENESSKPIADGKPVSVTIENGMISIQIANMLKEKGLIDDSQKFAEYLEEEGYAQTIWVGTYELRQGMTYEQIANTIGHKQ
ncbi:YceG-like family protein [Granulicatella balaenopterae]|uniref:YceG-like family protein n=1 Tax=Granulicatella balaenopterae TaxID=137733 RepID=A0A1H9MPY3_9LACT|nr:endolytic transglycosylase MltG [Granulicatella balaenopterae]SER25742.1 YceG-like family protein [Granulicatella balaenopterae]